MTTRSGINLFKSIVALPRSGLALASHVLRPYPRLPRTLQPAQAQLARRYAHSIPKPPSRTSQSSQPGEQQQEKPRKLLEPHYELTFTCVPCSHRSKHTISKQGYHKGSVLITCPSCRNRHIISDHLNIFGDRKITVEDLMKERGQLVKRGTLGEDGDVEFWEDGTVTDRGDAAAPGGITASPQPPHPTTSAGGLTGSGARPQLDGASAAPTDFTPSSRREFSTGSILFKSDAQARKLDRWLKTAIDRQRGQARYSTKEEHLEPGPGVASNVPLGLQSFKPEKAYMHEHASTRRRERLEQIKATSRLENVATEVQKQASSTKWSFTKEVSHANSICRRTFSDSIVTTHPVKDTDHFIPVKKPMPMVEKRQDASPGPGGFIGKRLEVLEKEAAPIFYKVESSEPWLHVARRRLEEGEMRSLARKDPNHNPWETLNALKKSRLRHFVREKESSTTPGNNETKEKREHSNEPSTQTNPQPFQPSFRKIDNQSFRTARPFETMFRKIDQPKAAGDLSSPPRVRFIRSETPEFKSVRFFDSWESSLDEKSAAARAYERPKLRPHKALAPRETRKYVYAWPEGATEPVRVEVANQRLERRKAALATREDNSWRTEEEIREAELQRHAVRLLGKYDNEWTRSKYRDIARGGKGGVEGLGWLSPDRFKDAMTDA